MTRATPTWMGAPVANSWGPDPPASSLASVGEDPVDELGAEAVGDASEPAPSGAEASDGAVEIDSSPGGLAASAEDPARAEPVDPVPVACDPLAVGDAATVDDEAAAVVVVVVVLLVVVVVGVDDPPHVPRPGTAVHVNPLVSLVLAAKVTSVFQ